jgi:hypothetical protein
VRRISLRYAQIGGGNMAQAAHTMTPAPRAAAAATTQSAPAAPTFERNVYAVRLPDGRLQLVTQ